MYIYTHTQTHTHTHTHIIRIHSETQVYTIQERHLEHSEVLSRPDRDTTVSGNRRGFCFELRPRGSASSAGPPPPLFFYAASADERAAWVAVLRKHAVHHDIDNGFDRTKKVLGTGAYATVFLAKDRAKQVWSRCRWQSGS